MRQYSTSLRNGWNNTYESVIGPSPRLQIFNGVVPVNCEDPNEGLLLIDMTLPSDWLGTSSAGIIGKQGLWAAIGMGTGLATYYRIRSADMVTVHEQGTVGIDNSFDMVMNPNMVVEGQSLSVNTWTIIAPGQ